MLVFCKKKVLIIQKLQIYTNTPFETSIQNLHCINVTADVSHLVLEKQTKCIPICMPGSSFIHIVEISE
jgi:hypothetical protein